MMKQWIALLLLLFFCSGAVTADDSELLKLVENNARTWLELLDSGKYKESWEQSSSQLKSRKSEAEWIKTITPIRSLRGTANARYLATAGATKSLSGLPDGDYIVLQFYATFAQKGLSLETVTLMKTENSTWEIVDYTLK